MSDSQDYIRFDADFNAKISNQPIFTTIRKQEHVDHKVSDLVDLHVGNKHMKVGQARVLDVEQWPHLHGLPAGLLMADTGTINLQAAYEALEEYGIQKDTPVSVVTLWNQDYDIPEGQAGPITPEVY